MVSRAATRPASRSRGWRSRSKSRPWIASSSASGQRRLRRIVDQKTAVLLLGQSVGRDRIVVVVKGPEHRDEGLFVRRRRLVGGQHQGRFRRVAAGITEAANRERRLPCRQGPSQLDHGPVRHAVEQVIGLGVKEDRTAHPIVPGIVMGDPAQAGLDAAQHQGHGLL